MRDFLAKRYLAEWAMGRAFNYYRETMLSKRMLKLPVIAIAGSHGVGDILCAAIQSVGEG